MCKQVAIIGAGIVGISAAIWLQRAGHRVTIYDRVGPAGGTSFGNAGVLAASSVVPLTVPGLLWKAPGMLLDANAPLFLRWSYLPKLLPFLVKFLANANSKDIDRISKALDLLLHDTVDQHLALSKGTGAEQYVHPQDYVFGYTNKKAFDKDAFGWSLRRELGVEFEELNEQQIAEYDPVMAGRFGYAVRNPNHGRISDPGAYVKALASYVEENGGKIVIEDIGSPIIVNGRCIGLATKQGTIEADEYVIASGVWSNQLLSEVNSKIPMESERGYHIEFINPSITPKHPIMVASGKFVITPMDGRLRCAGILELGGLNNKPSKAPIDLLKRQTLALFPDLKYDRIDEWMGHRPSTADSLPVIGAMDSASNLWSAFGHQHIGLSGGPKTGRWISQLISGETPNVDISPFRPARY